MGVVQKRHRNGYQSDVLCEFKTQTGLTFLQVSIYCTLLQVYGFGIKLWNFNPQKENFMYTDNFVIDILSTPCTVSHQAVDID